MLTIILRFIYLLSIALWIGGMAFFSFMAAPSIFHVLAREEAGKVVADIFPKYYWQGIICGAIALADLSGTGDARALEYVCSSSAPS